MENRRMSKNVFPLTIMKDDIVISGISGRFPESDSVDEFRDNLYNNVDMITSDDRRWPIPLYGMSPRMGKLKEIDKLDSTFFGIVPKVADEVDPQARILLETTYEAICDAGINPQSLRGSNTGVYVGYTSVTMPDGVPQEVQEDIQASKVESLFWFQGSSKAFYANRVSFVFDFHGPSMSIDVACAASMVALDIAVTDLRLGKCDQAIVAGVSINLQPFTNHIYQVNNIGSKEGMSRVWDQDANGYVRGETVASLFLQRKPDSKRIYATVLHSRSNIDGYKVSGMFFPSSESQYDLMVTTYTEAGINPHDVNYFEGHGTGTKAGDSQEAKAILEAYCKDRKTKLPVGLLKSNIGHGEGASGVASLVKLLIVYENKRIPANLNLKTLKSEIAEMVPPLIPITENTDYEPGIAGVNSFGIGGVNCHALLKPNKKEISDNALNIADKIPRLVNICGRTEEAVNYIFEFIEKNPSKITRDFLALIGEIVNPTPAIYSSGFPFRGSIVIKKSDNNYQYIKKVSKVENAKRPICYFFSGMGSQWTAMAKSLMDIEIFYKSIQKAANILKQFNIDLLYVLLSDDPKALDEKIHHFVAITSMQVALVDVFAELGVVPDYVIGHSFGEIACGYADGCLTLEQAIITSYWRGKAIKDANVEHGMMAAVGLTWEETKNRCPTGVYTACHNSVDSVTISGAFDVVNQFVEQLVSENIFAREVQCANIPFHCPLLLPAAGKMTEALRSTITDPKPRSSKWISTSISEHEWTTDKASYASADYFVNNLISPVLFHDSSKYIPKDAIIIELAPHALFSAIFKRSMPSAQYIGLMKRNNNAANLEMFITAIGQLYQLGVNVLINKLYPKVEWPVARSTQSISSLMKWDHNKTFLVKKYPDYHFHATASDFVQRFSLSNPDYQFLKDHAFDGKCVFPATGYLLMAWRRLAASRGEQWYEFPVAFENVHFKRLTPMSQDNEVKLTVRLLDPTGEFVVLEGDHVAASGRIFVPEENHLQYQNLVNEEYEINDEMWKGHKLDTNDFYTELNVRGFDYGPKFRQILEVQYEGLNKSYSKVKWEGNWIIFVESLIQLYVTHTTSRSIYVSLSLPSLKCDPRILFGNRNKETSSSKGDDSREDSAQEEAQKSQEIKTVITDSNLKCVISKGIELKGLTFANIPLKNIMRGVQMEKYEFVPNIEDNAIEEINAKELTDYISSCDLIALKLSKIFKKLDNENNKDNNNEKLNKLLKLPNNDNQILLKLLISLYQSIFDENGNLINERIINEESIKKLINENNYDLSLDILNLTSTNGRLMRSILDIVNENNQRNISIAEINSGNGIMAKDVLYNMGFFFHYPLVVDYTIANNNIKDLPQDLQNSGYHLIDWDRTKTNFPTLSAPVDLLIYKDSTDFWDLNFESFSSELYNYVSDGGFLLGIFRTKLSSAEKLLNQFSEKPITNLTLSERLMAFENYAKLAKFSLISRKSDSISSTAVLLRKVAKNVSPDNQAVVEVKFGKYDEWVEELKTKFTQYKERPRNENIWLCANDSNLNGLIGLVNCLRQEPGGDRFRCIFSDGKLEMPIDFNKEPYNRLLRNDLVINVFRDNRWGSYRLLNLERNYDKIETTEAYLDIVKKGDLSSLKWFDLSTLENICEEEVNVKIYYSGIDFRDIAVASGQLGADFIDRVIGFEFAGRRSDTGERVIGITTGKSIATSIDINPNLLINIPDKWSLEEGASVISGYFAVWYSLINRAQLEEGETVFIHSGTDANGLIAIKVCQQMNCRIFTTSSSDEKRRFLRENYDIPDAHIFNPNDPNFMDEILIATHGIGVDVVFNSLSNDKLVSIHRIVANYGRYIEIDNYDQTTPNNQLLRNILYYNISSIISEENFESLIPKIFKGFAKWFNEGLENGSVEPINREVFKRDNIDKAFRHLSSGQSIGKVLIKIRDEELFEKTTLNSKPVKIMANTKSWFDSNKVYILVGGLGGLGLEVAYWMVTRGARKLVLVSRSGIKNDYQYVFVKRISSAAKNDSEKDTIVKISTSDPSSITGAERLITEASNLGPVGGIFHFATVLHDAFIEDQSAATFKKVCAPKVDALGYLDAVTRKFCPKLDYFVAFSSQSSGRGFVGQNNYGYANSVMEHICENRKRDGYHGLAIQYGPIGDVGLWAQNENIDLASIGMVINTQRIPSCLEVLDRFLHCQHAIVSTIIRVEGSQQSSSSGGSSKNQIWQGIGMDLTSLPDNLTLGDIGMESILAVEMQQRIEREYEVSLTTDEIKLISVGQIKEYQNDELQSIKTKIADFKKSVRK